MRTGVTDANSEKKRRNSGEDLSSFVDEQRAGRQSAETGRDHPGDNGIPFRLI